LTRSSTFGPAEIPRDPLLLSLFFQLFQRQSPSDSVFTSIFWRLASESAFVSFFGCRPTSLVCVLFASPVHSVILFSRVFVIFPLSLWFWWKCAFFFSLSLFWGPGFVTLHYLKRVVALISCSISLPPHQRVSVEDRHNPLLLQGCRSGVFFFFFYSNGLVFHFLYFPPSFASLRSSLAFLPSFFFFFYPLFPRLRSSVEFFRSECHWSTPFSVLFFFFMTLVPRLANARVFFSPSRPVYRFSGVLFSATGSPC